MNLPTWKITLWVSSALGLLTVVTVLHGAAPTWWESRSVLDPGQVTNDYAAVNIGQLKHMAKKAGEELQATLPGGAGEAVLTMIASFAAVTTERNDYAAVNAGQLKAVAKPIYDRLIAQGYTTTYPWSDTDPARNDFALVNIGQLKHVFSFDLSVDTDEDGLPDWWEMGQFGNLTGAAEEDLENGTGDGLTNAEEYWLGTDAGQLAEAGSASDVGIVIHTNFE